jgi:hypothetical protein
MQVDHIAFTVPRGYRERWPHKYARGAPRVKSPIAATARQRQLWRFSIALRD